MGSSTRLLIAELAETPPVVPHPVFNNYTELAHALWQPPASIQEAPPHTFRLSVRRVASRSCSSSRAKSSCNARTSTRVAFMPPWAILRPFRPPTPPPVANPCGQTICITSFGPAWQEKVQFYVSGIGRVNIFDEMRRVVHGELTRRSRTYLTTTFHCCYPFMTTIRPRYQVAAALYHDQLQHLLLSSRVLIPALDASGS